MKITPILFLFTLAFTSQLLSQECSDLLISEVVEGWSNNKAIEIYNPTYFPINASNYSLVRHLGNSFDIGNPTYLTDIIIQPFDVYIIVLDKTDPNGVGFENPVWDELQLVADTFVNPQYLDGLELMYFNGNDAIALLKDNGETLVDLFGKIGDDINTNGWGSYINGNGQQAYISADHTLVRKPLVTQGIINNPEVFDLLLEYDSLPANTFSNLGFHICDCQEGTGCTDIMACNFDSEATFDIGNCCYSDCGCSDPIAENYSESVTCDDGTCEYIEGCTNELAINFNEDATLDNETCLFKITGTVFYDMNENGIMDSLDYGLPLHNISIEALNLNFITNEAGSFIANIGLEQIAEFNLQENSLFPFNTTPNPQTFYALQSESTHLWFGVSNELAEFSIETSLYPFGEIFLCNYPFEYNVTFTNQGNVAIDGVVELAYDSLFQGYNPITPVDSSATDTVYMSFENLLPGQTEIFSIDLITPLVDFIGEEVTHYANVYGYYLGEEVSFGTDSLHMEIACAYDPNDKQAFPPGYTDEHWLLPETEQEFLVRFQNTGNAPAQDVRIQDTIDVNYDLETFRLVANSHSVMTTINEETRVVDFFFENIQLPDSVNNEPESHGLVSYAISSYSDLVPATELNNTAYIYFDNNEPIITNTTWNSIHECGGEAAFEASAAAVCVDETVQFTSTYPALENYSWSVNGEAESSESSFFKTFTEAGTYEVEFLGENPLCIESSLQTITVYANPTVTISQNGDLLTSSEGDAYQWFLNGEVLDGATAQEYSVTEDGTYTVEVTNAGLCSGTSEGVMVVNIAELEKETILLYPNPMSDKAFLEFEDASDRTVRLIDSTGKEVKIWNNVATQRVEISRDELAAGNYVVSVEVDGRVRNLQFIMR